VIRLASQVRTRLVKGSHIVVRRLFDHDRAYMFQGRDGRVLYAIPYERDFTLIGPTELVLDGHPGAVAAEPEEITYLCRAASVHFREPVDPQQVVRTFAGARVLHGDATAASTRWRHDHRVVLDAPPREAPLLTVHGGQIATHRRIAEQALAALGRYLPPASPWTRWAPLPGGDFPFDGIDALVVRARGLWPFLSAANLRRLVAAYGTRIDDVLGCPGGMAHVAASDMPAPRQGPAPINEPAQCPDCQGTGRSPVGLGPSFGDELTGAEVRYLMRHEWAQGAEDVLWRRSKLGLRVGPDDEAALVRFMAAGGRHEAAAE
jgi:glycerol-3-phosphate dehydrogenase